MKRIYTIVAAVLCLLTSCEKEDEPTPTKLYTLDVPAAVNLIDKTPADVRELYKGDFVSETNTLGVVELTYQLSTEKTKYQVIFKANTSGIINYIKILAPLNMPYSDAVTYYKSETDKCQNSYPNKFYIGQRYHNDSSSRYENRSEFWYYMANNPISGSDYLTEKWLLINGEEINNKLTYLTLTTTYFPSPNGIAMEVEKSEYS